MLLRLEAAFQRKLRQSNHGNNRPEYQLYFKDSRDKVKGHVERHPVAPFGRLFLPLDELLEREFGCID
jgi:hypothetical protein